jgi:hypothetical protein
MALLRRPDSTKCGIFSQGADNNQKPAGRERLNAAPVCQAFQRGCNPHAVVAAGIRAAA